MKDMKNFDKFNAFEKNVFTEMRGIIVESNRSLTNENLVKAVTLNENLSSLGFCFNAVDLVKIAKSSVIDTLFYKIQKFNPEVKAKPMYPDFPTQVMEMDEATFRFHQLVHYFSTYGMESIFGVEVKNGWLPEVEETEKTESDVKLFPDKVLKVYTLDEVYDFITKKIAGKSERLTEPEVALVRYVVLEAHKNIPDIPFKENIGKICYDLMVSDDVDAAFTMLRATCKHTGDVLRLLRMYMGRRHYKPMPTSMKRRFVNLIESYPAYDLAENLWPSRRTFSNEYASLLNGLSYSRFSKSAEHMEVVQDARDTKLKSWKGKVEQKLNAVTDENKAEVLEFIGARPGELFRMMVRLFRLGFSKEMILDELKKHLNKYRLQMILATMNSYSVKAEENKENESVVRDYGFVKEVCIDLVKEVLATRETPIMNKKVFLDRGIYDFKHSLIETNEKSQESGYIRSGLAFAIPEDVKILRFFVYWNDKKRTDIDLHSYAHLSDGREERIAWYTEFKNEFAVFSGDITHSDAAEYIDVDLEKAIETDVSYIYNNIHSYTGNTFKEIETIFTGMMGVSKLAKDKKEMKLHDVKNEFFHHELNTNVESMVYSLIDVHNNFMRIVGKNTNWDGVYAKDYFSLEDYLETLFTTQNVTLVDTKEDAEIILTLDKPVDENGLSLIDENYFLE